MEVAWTPFSRVATGQWDREDRIINTLPIIQNLWMDGGREGGTDGRRDAWTHGYSFVNALDAKQTD